MLDGRKRGVWNKRQTPLSRLKATAPPQGEPKFVYRVAAHPLCVVPPAKEKPTFNTESGILKG